MKITRANVYHNLAVMLEAGLPITRALRTAVPGVRCTLRDGFVAAAEGVADGETMSATMAKHPQVFEPLEVLLVDVGETSGNLPECVEQLSKWFTFCDRGRKMLTSGMFLPAIIFHAAVFIVPLPKFFLTNMTFAGYLWRVLAPLLIAWAIVFGIVAVIRYTPKTGPARLMFDKLMMRIPILRGAIRQLCLSRYFRVCAMMLSAGVPIVRATRQATEVGGNSEVMGLVRGGAESAEAGHPVSEGFSPRLERQYLEMWQTGEVTGDLDKMCWRIADTSGERAEGAIKALCTWVPRVIYFILMIWMAINVVQGFTGVYGGMMGR